MEELDSFMKRLASGSPAPGGGAASALVSTVGSALASMVASLTIGKKGYEAEQQKMVEVQKNATEISEKLRKLMKDDEDAFNLIVAAWSLPKSTDSEKTKRKVEIEKASLVAISVPINIARESLKVLEFAAYLSEKGNKNAITDSACSSEFALAAIKGALFNARINLKSISDAEKKTQLEMNIRLIMDTANDLHRTAEKNVSKAMS
ncbi:MAG: cyclodeaminase/cyclohydrolase family protein [Thermoplasmataceae archaeon]